MYENIGYGILIVCALVHALRTQLTINTYHMYVQQYVQCTNAHLTVWTQGTLYTVILSIDQTEHACHVYCLEAAEMDGKLAETSSCFHQNWTTCKQNKFLPPLKDCR